ncbi:MAG TPA: PHP domain-containing protein [Acidimicrobiales bacterium]|nr:PHP domain-containing protein [Acidimicrobiales bacterium]
MIDLHTHSTLSDGTDPPGRIAELAAAAGCRAVALTDHDTLGGQPEARRRAGELGIELVPGCEVSCALGDTSAHVLVYFVDTEQSPLGEELVRLRADRLGRNRRLAERLAELGLPATYDEAVAVSGSEESVGRPHFAGVLVEHGAAESVQDAFDRWLGRGAPAHVRKARVSPAEVSRLARASGGVAVLAHPLSIGLAPDGLAGLVADLAETGFAGIEAHYANYAPEDRAALVELARRSDVVATGGSDYHGTVKPGLAVGTGRGDLSVPDQALADLEARRPA